MQDDLAESLESGLRQMSLVLPDGAEQKLIRYITLLEKWNRTHNLTAVRELSAMVPRHLLDSLSISHLVEGNTLLDIGSGAGLPGIPLSIAKPHVNVTLVDSVQKKTRFMLFAAQQLGLANVRVLHTRIEQLDRGDGFDTIVARAFASLEKLSLLAAPVAASGGALVAMTGKPPQPQDTHQLHGFVLENVQELSIPDETAQRNVVVLRRSGD